MRPPLHLVPTLQRRENEIRGEVCELAELLRTHIDLALSTGTDMARIAALLQRVRRAVLDLREVA